MTASCGLQGALGWAREKGAALTHRTRLRRFYLRDGHRLGKLHSDMADRGSSPRGTEGVTSQGKGLSVSSEAEGAAWEQPSFLSKLRFPFFVASVLPWMVPCGSPSSAPLYTMSQWRSWKENRAYSDVKGGAPRIKAAPGPAARLVAGRSLSPVGGWGPSTAPGAPQT